MDASENTLYRLSDDAMIGGVCAGLAKHLDVDVSVVRAAFVGLTVFSGFGLAAYLALWMLLDLPPEDEELEEETQEDAVEDVNRFSELSQQPIVSTPTK